VLILNSQLQESLFATNSYVNISTDKKATVKIIAYYRLHGWWEWI